MRYVWNFTVLSIVSNHRAVRSAILFQNPADFQSMIILTVSFTLHEWEDISANFMQMILMNSRNWTNIIRIICLKMKNVHFAENWKLTEDFPVEFKWSKYTSDIQSKLKNKMEKNNNHIPLSWNCETRMRNTYVCTYEFVFIMHMGNSYLNECTR